DIRAAATPDARRAELEQLLTGVLDRMPAHRRTEEMRDSILKDIPARALDLALAVVENPEGGDDAH
ncbi:MAG: DNA repair exonuclease, partial [Komagataeibacter saccharivorans]